MKDNMSFRQMPLFLNQHRMEKGRTVVEKSNVMNCFDRMAPKIDQMEKVVQGEVPKLGSRCENDKRNNYWLCKV